VLRHSELLIGKKQVKCNLYPYHYQYPIWTSSS